MSVSLHADRDILLAYARRRRVLAGILGVICVAIAIAILAIEYRLMIFAIVALALPLVAAIEAVRARRNADAWGFVRFECEETDMVVRTGREEVHTDQGAEPFIAARRDALVVAMRTDNRWRRWVIPGDPAAVRAVADALRAQDIPVAREPGLGGLAGLLASVLVARGLAIVATVLVAAGLANFGLALLGKGGSLLYGAAFLGGAFACLVVVALAHLLIPSGHGDRAA